MPPYNLEINNLENNRILTDSPLTLSLKSKADVFSFLLEK